jgi:hypothetical protein
MRTVPVFIGCAIALGVAALVTRWRPGTPSSSPNRLALEDKQRLPSAEIRLLT